MTTSSNRARNAFAISLRGSSIRSSFILVPATTDDRINNAIDRKFGESQPDPDTALPTSWGRFWLRSRRRAA